MIKNLNIQFQQIFEDKYHGRWSKEFLKDVQRLKAGEPLDYIIGWAWFLNCKIDLRYKPLVPRPETEYWAEKAIKEIASSKSQMANRKLKILDVFSGSGCIGVAILKNIPQAKVTFSEIDSKLIKQIEINLRLNGVASRGRAVRSDAFKNIKGGFDFIIANPPYISLRQKSKVQKQVLKYEPKLALFGGKNGLYFIKKLLEQAPKFLKPNGQIWFEHDPSQKKAIEKIIKQNKNYSGAEFFKDQYKRWRFMKIDKKI